MSTLVPEKAAAEKTAAEENEAAEEDVKDAERLQEAEELRALDEQEEALDRKKRSKEKVQRTADRMAVESKRASDKAAERSQKLQDQQQRVVAANEMRVQKSLEQVQKTREAKTAEITLGAGVRPFAQTATPGAARPFSLPTPASPALAPAHDKNTPIMDRQKPGGGRGILPSPGLAPAGIFSGGRGGGRGRGSPGVALGAGRGLLGGTWSDAAGYGQAARMGGYASNNPKDPEFWPPNSPERAALQESEKTGRMAGDKDEQDGCLLPGCNRPRHVRDGVTLDYCGFGHAQLHAAMDKRAFKEERDRERRDERMGIKQTYPDEMTDVGEKRGGTDKGKLKQRKSEGEKDRTGGGGLAGDTMGGERTTAGGSLAAEKGTGREAGGSEASGGAEEGGDAGGVQGGGAGREGRARWGDEDYDTDDVDDPDFDPGSNDGDDDDGDDEDDDDEDDDDEDDDEEDDDDEEEDEEEDDDDDDESSRMATGRTLRRRRSSSTQPWRA